MSSHPFKAEVRRQTGAVVIDLHGEIDKFADADLNAAYGEAENGNPGKVILNFKDVHYMNSTGIALIVGLLAKARKSRLPMAVYGLSDHYLEIFQITRLADFMQIYPDETSALQNA